MEMAATLAQPITRPSFHLPPVVLAVALALSFIAGAAAAPLIGLIESTGIGAVPAGEFDSVTFRAGERQSLTFDPVQFRCEEQERC
jgi:hypothetical protein